MMYADKTVLAKARNAALDEDEFDIPPQNDGKKSLETVPFGNMVPKVKFGAGISANSFSNVKGTV